MGHKRKGHSTPKRKQPGMRMISQEIYDDLVSTQTSFNLCLAAIVRREGEENEDGNFIYTLRLEDFEAISESNVRVRVEDDVDGRPGTNVILEPKKEI